MPQTQEDFNEPLEIVTVPGWELHEWGIAGLVMKQFTRKMSQIVEAWEDLLKKTLADTD